MNKFGDGREQVNRHQHLVTLGARGNLSGPAHDAWLARAAFPASAFAFAQGIGRAGVITVTQPRAVVRGEDHPGLAFQPCPLERVHNLAD